MRSLIFISLFLLTLVHISAAFAQGRSSPIIIRDTEIEKILQEWGAPLLQAAGMPPESVNIVLVQSPDLNAFVAGGSNIFFFTGLIERTENPGELLGVYAHELGHVAGGHLISMQGALERASFESILGMVLGIGAAIATGNGEVASAVVMGSSSMAQRRFLSHSRVNESAADQAAMSFMERAGKDPSGMGSFLSKLESEELLPSHQQSEYVRTHPLTQNRIQAVQARAEKSPYYRQGWPEEWVEQHARMKAKILAFTNPGRVPWVYSDSDRSIAAQYARAVAAYRENNIDRAIRAIDALIEAEPNNPYFLELKGQMLVDFGRIDQAVPYYRQAISLLPDAPLIRIAYAHALMQSSGGQASLNEVIENLQRALVVERRSGHANRLLATAYGRNGREDIARVYLAEEALLQRNFDYAKRQAESALQSLEPNSREAIKAQDIVVFVDSQKGLGNSRN
ncbi:MAG: M48 family metalloprotease [Alphaproteobacteria bacterium]